MMMLIILGGTKRHRIFSAIQLLKTRKSTGIEEFAKYAWNSVQILYIREINSSQTALDIAEQCLIS
jgi:hypothetical protein